MTLFTVGTKHLVEALDKLEAIEKYEQGEGYLLEQPTADVYVDDTTLERLEYLRSQIRAECISYDEIAELQGLVEFIEEGDAELLEWAGVPEFPEEVDNPEKV